MLFCKGKAVLLSIAVLAGAVPSVSYASTTQQEINQKQQEKEELENQKEQKAEELEGLKGEKNTLIGKLNNLNEQLTLVSERLADLEGKIIEKEDEIAKTQAALDEARETERWQMECMQIRIKSMYEQNESSYLEVFFNAKSFSDILNFVDYMQMVAEYDQKMLDEYEENRKFIEDEEAQLQREKAELDELKLEAEAEKSKVSGLINQTSNTISEYASDIEEAEQKMRDYEAEIKKKEEDLTYLKKKLAEEMRLSQEAANATWRDISEVSFDEGDKYLLANLIYCEAGGEPYAGQLAVGSVVINRVLSSKYPDTVVGVIYQKSQFSPVGSGRLELALASNRATANCYRAAEEAMSGVTNVGNCVYFRTPVEGLTGISIGGHIFY